MFSVFRKTKELEGKIDEFLNVILEAALEFKQGMKYYLEGDFDEFEKRSEHVDQLEGRADRLRREIENKLYMEMLLPEARGDVLALLENSDDVLNIVADTIVEFSVEKPEFPPEINSHFMGLVDVSLEAVEEMVATVRAYFKDLTAVRDHVTKIMFFEKESDKIGERIKRFLFDKSDIDLSRKIHIRTFVTYLQTIADKAEDVGDRVSIYTIKRLM
ncbi:MAG: DUF47 family protein [Candidatus Hydrothermae bacterium]|nr:DUF47 family protein [Candidatus Hydrothermae bacterium]